MTRHPFISLLFSGLILLIIFCVWAFTSFDFGETFDQYRNQALILFLVIALYLALSIYHAGNYFKSGEKMRAAAICILPFIACILAFIYYTRFLDHHTPFNKNTWNRSKLKPLNMTVSLAKGNTLIGLNKSQVKELLGQATENEGENADRQAVSYFAEDNWIFVIFFKEDKVVGTELRQPWLCI